MTPLIGLGGYARAGKSTAAAVLAGEGWAVRECADPVRKFAYEQNAVLDLGYVGGVHFGAVPLRGIVDAMGWEDAKTVPAVREHLQAVGEAGRRAIGPDVWIDQVLRCPAPLMVVSGVRFVNESDAIRDRGGVLVRVNRPGVGPVNGHVSERELAHDDVWDHVIVNDGSLDVLRRCVLAVVGYRFPRLPRAGEPAT